MKKVVAIVIVLALIVVTTVSCNEKTDRPQLDISEVVSEEPTPTVNVESLNPIGSVENYDTNKMIKIPYEESLPEGTKVVYNDDSFTIFQYISGFSDATRVKIKILVEYGIRNGKLVYKEYSGFDPSKKESDYKFGFLNSDFSILTEPIYDTVYPFEYGCAVVKTANGFGVISTDGSSVLSCEYDIKPEIMDGVIKIPVEKTLNSTNYSFYDSQTGEYRYLIKKEYIETGDNYKFTMINSDGTSEELLDLEYLGEDELQKYQDETSMLWGYKDGFGDIIIEARFTEAHEFIDGYARVRLEKYGFINTLGETIIPFIYVKASDMDNEVANVILDGERFLITRDGKRINDYYFDVVKKYGDGLAAVVIHGESGWRYINEEGEPAYDGMFSKAGTFSHGIAPVMGIMNLEDIKWSQNYYYISKLGESIFGSLLFTGASDLNEDGYAIAWSQTTQTTDDGGVGTAYEYYIIVAKK